MKLNFVWFDLGYTLVYMNREKYLRNMLRDKGADLELRTIEKAYHMTDKLFMRDYRGVLGKKRDEFMPLYFEKLLDYLQISLDVNEALCDFYKEESKVIVNERLWLAYEKSYDVLSMLKLSGIGTGIISNWDNSARRVLRQNRLDELLDVVVVSSEVDYAKPDEKIFRYALDKAGVNSDECLYVGDNFYDDVTGSRKVKMEALLINPYGREGIEEISDVPVISNISELPGFLEENYNIRSI